MHGDTGAWELSVTGGSRSKVQEGAAYKVQEGSLYKVQSPFFREISQEVVACKVQSDFF